MHHQQESSVVLQILHHTARLFGLQLIILLVHYSGWLWLFRVLFKEQRCSGSGDFLFCRYCICANSNCSLSSERYLTGLQIPRMLTRESKNWHLLDETNS